MSRRKHRNAGRKRDATPGMGQRLRTGVRLGLGMTMLLIFGTLGAAFILMEFASIFE